MILKMKQYDISEFNAKFFDDASLAWSSNKIKKDCGHYVYKCGYIHKNGRQCSFAGRMMVHHRRMRCARHRRYNGFGTAIVSGEEDEL